VNGFEYDDFARNAELIQAGELAMREALPEVNRWLAPKVVINRIAALKPVEGR